MLTGGFRTQQAMEEAVANGEVDIVGLGRGFAVYPF
jgi:2,4-dienoyl-CoA reductase-like NADH-dependent reductase (Old Yellow Enzyme family)